jgi:hypothetical protein
MVVSSNPSGAEVYVDERLIGTTPTTTGELAPGDHKVRLRPTGAPVVEFNATVAPKGPTAVDVKVGVGGAITPDQLAELDEARTWNAVWGGTKIGVGSLCAIASLPFCCAACILATPPSADFGLAAVMGVPGAVLLAPGAGLLGWGVMDFVNAPEAPGGSGSTVTVTPPDGAAKTFDVPFPMAN